MLLVTKTTRKLLHQVFLLQLIKELLQNLPPEVQTMLHFPSPQLEM